MMKKRIIQVMVALCLILTLMPMNAKAAEPTLTTGVWTKTEAGKVRVYCQAGVENPPATDYYLTFVFYDHDGRYTRTVWVKNRTEPIGCEFGGEESYAKVCLLDTETYVPLCESKKVQLYINANFYDGDKLIDTRTVKNGDTYSELPAPPSREGSKFLGWYTAAEGGTKITETSVVDSAADISLYAHWVKAEYKVSFYDGDKLIETRTVKNGAAYGELPVLDDKDGYELGGWSATEGGNYVTKYTVPSGAEDIVLYAQWRKTKYLISFYDGDELVEPPRTVDRYAAYGDLPVLEKDGCEFLGWYTAVEGGKKVTAKTAADGEKDIVLYARWNKIGYEVNFYDGDELVGTKTVTSGETYGDLPVPAEKVGYHFLGWFTAAEGGDQITAATKVTTTTDITLYAQWKELREIPANYLDFGEADVIKYSEDYDVYAKYGNFKVTYEDGATYDKYQFGLKYKRQGDSEYVTDPVDVGTYDVTVTRAADKNYKAFEHTYEGVLVINKGVHKNDSVTGMEFVNIVVADRGYTWIELDLVPTGYTTFSEEAELTFYVSTDSGETWSYASGSDHVVYFPQRFTNKLHVAVQIRNDPNWEDWISTPRDSSMYPNHPEEYQYLLLSTPEKTWTQFKETDCFLRYAAGGEFTITTAEELTGLAYLVNDEGLDFEGRTVKLANDIDLSGYEWVPIGAKSTPFRGTFDGQGHTISNVYIDDLTDLYDYSGLFGHTVNAEVRNLNLQGSYIDANVYGGGVIGWATNTHVLRCDSYAMVDSGAENCGVGGIVGWADNAYVEKCINRYGRISSKGNVGGIVGKGTNQTVIDSCRNYSIVTNPFNATGGIVGRGSDITVVNCLNYGQVTADVENTLGVGGIAGIVEIGEVYNCVNFGPVTGYSTVGGIVGLNETADCELYNCYNVGSVWGKTRSYIGAVIGRNKENMGKVYYCYYQAGSAKYSDNGDALGAGTAADKGGTNGTTNLEIGYFTVKENWDMEVFVHWYGGDQNAVSGGTLIDVLNAWRDAHVYDYLYAPKVWITDPSHYPVPYTDLSN